MFRPSITIRVISHLSVVSIGYWLISLLVLRKGAGVPDFSLVCGFLFWEAGVVWRELWYWLWLDRDALIGWRFGEYYTGLSNSESRGVRAGLSLVGLLGCLSFILLCHGSEAVL